MRSGQILISTVLLGTLLFPPSASAVMKWAQKPMASNHGALGLDETCVAIPSGIISMWSGEGDATDAIDNNDGLIRGNVTFPAGKVGRAFGLDGASWVAVEATPALKPPEITVEAWARSATPTWSEYGWIVSARDQIPAIDHGYLIHPNKGTTTVSVDVGVSGNFNAVTANVTDIMKWHHYALTYDGHTLCMYIDGQFVGSDSRYPGPITYDTVDSVFIGRDPFGTRLGRGEVDEVSVYCRALSAQEIKTIFESGSAGKCRTQVALDLKPGSCPNPLNPKSRGVLPGAILGGPGFDVRDIDVASLELEGVSPIRTHLEDVSTPGESECGVECPCSTDGPDGFEDLTLKFRTQDIVTAIGPVVEGETRTLTITGKLRDGTSFGGGDCVVIRGGKHADGPHMTRLELSFDRGPSARVQVVKYTLGARAEARVVVYDLAGRLVGKLVDAVQPAGVHAVRWDTHGLASGVYLVRVEAGGAFAVRKVVLAQ